MTAMTLAKAPVQGQHGKPASRGRLGEILVWFGRIARRQLSRALTEQACSGLPLGQILIRQGLISPQELNAALAWQSEQVDVTTIEANYRLGELLVEQGSLSRKQLDAALKLQQQERRPLGELLIASGLLSRLEVQRFLHLQRRLRWSLLVTLTPVLLAGCGSTGAGIASAPVQVAPSLHSTSSGIAAQAAPASPAPIPANSQVISARPITGDVGPTGNVTISVQFPQQIGPTDAPRQRLQLVPDNQQSSR